MKVFIKALALDAEQILGLAEQEADSPNPAFPGPKQPTR